MALSREGSSSCPVCCDRASVFAVSSEVPSDLVALHKWTGQYWGSILTRSLKDLVECKIKGSQYSLLATPPKDLYCVEMQGHWRLKTLSRGKVRIERHAMVIQKSGIQQSIDSFGFFCELLLSINNTRLELIISIHVFLKISSNFANNGRLDELLIVFVLIYTLWEL